MKISETLFRGRKGLLLETEKLEAIMLPGNGGKMASLKVKSTGLELLKQVPGDTEYIDLTYDGDYCSADVYAFDDMFPTIDPWDNGKRVYADHGEVIRLPWNYGVRCGRLSMDVTSKFGDYNFKKVISETPDGFLKIAYTAENLTDEKLPFLWAAHMLLEVQDGAVISYDDMENSTAEVVFSSKGFMGPRGRKIPVKKGMDILENGKPDGVAYKYYILEKRSEVRYGCVKIGMDKAPYIGVWMNNGEFKNFKNVAMEVCTGGFDTPGYAKEHGHDIYLNPKGKKSWSITIGICE